MAKARKQKGDGGGAGGGATVLHQKLCVSIDMENQLIYGYTEIKVLLADNDTFALHADNMTIRSILVDGETAEFDYSPHWKNEGDQPNWSSISCLKTAADAACSTYTSALNREAVPNLIVSYERSVKSITEQQLEENSEKHEENSGRIEEHGLKPVQASDDQIVNECNGSAVEEQKEKENGNEKGKENGIETENEKVKNIRLVHIDYILEKAETGIHFVGNVLHSSSQIRRAHCWFPCIDSTTQRCPFDLEFTVSMDLIAVSNGDLLYQVLSKEDPTKKTYVYKLNTPVSAQWISLVVGPLEVLPDSNDISVSHICLSPALSKLQNTIAFFHDAYSCYEDYLATPFPLGLYKQIFLPPEMTVLPTSLGASTCIFSSDILHDEKVIDQIIGTRIKLAYALAKQWFGIYTSAEEPNDEWLLDGLAGFLTEIFINRFLGNNEARYRRFKANSTVCESDVSGATALSSPAASSDLYGTQTIGSYGKVRSLKAVAVLQMLEKQMGPDSFRKILQVIVAPNRASRTLSTKELRHLANKVGNLERPFLKEFFPRWVESCGCPVMRLGISYSRKRNMIELAVSRGCTTKATPDSDNHTNGDTREGDAGWPGMMSVRVHETDGAYDHPVLPMAGEALQVVEIQCHSKLAAKRVWKSKKSTKFDGSDDNIDVSTQENRASIDSPLQWIRVDPEMEYLAEIHFHQPVQMWINQLEKDKDVISQSQAISVLEKLPQLSSAVINALNNFLNDTKAFWRVRVEAAYALAVTASEATDLAGLLHLVKFYKSRRFDADIGMPRLNDFHDIPEYFVLEAIPHAVALVRSSDKNSPKGAVEFILQLLKYNDNNGNIYSDVYWLSAMVQAIGELELGQQDRICELITPFRNMDKPWKVRIEASRVLIDLELHHKGLDAALLLFLKYVDEEKSLRGATKLAVHVLRLCQANTLPQFNDQISLTTLIGLLHLLAGAKAYNNVFLRHHVFCILQVAAGRSPTLFGVPKVVTPPLVVQDICSDQHTKADSSIPQPSRPQEPSTSTPSVREVLPTSGPTKDADNISNCSERRNVVKIRVKLTASSSKASDSDHRVHSHGGRNENEAGPCSSMSVDAPMVGAATEPLNVSNHNIEEQNSCHDRESRMSASVGNAKLMDRHEISKELQCTADSRLVVLPKDQFSPAVNPLGVVDKPGGQLEVVSTSYDGNLAPESVNGVETKERKKKDKKDKKRKRDEKRDKKDDPEYLEKKRLKKEKKKMEKESARKQLEGEGKATPEQRKIVKPSGLQEVLPARPPTDPVRSAEPAPSQSAEPAAVRSSEPQISSKETTADTARTAARPRIKIRVKPLLRKPEGS
ncbi:transcription initiation factor TFIID subunit 2 [Panicum miliaceum]|uniref:Transcription initiation factor TFIID subunit 2 n=1 Tax=Panicum miliaceum TaxID=4540 RepID=A0A3L6T6B0_PANMI|nr:transcription initiation factor TFIID subunit 2 [Panicum miliaceum]